MAGEFGLVATLLEEQMRGATELLMSLMKVLYEEGLLTKENLASVGSPALEPYRDFVLEFSRLAQERRQEALEQQKTPPEPTHGGNETLN